MHPGALERQSRHGMISAWANSEARVGQLVDVVAGLVGQMVQEPMLVINLNELSPDRSGWEQSDAVGAPNFGALARRSASILAS